MWQGYVAATLTWLMACSSDELELSGVSASVVVAPDCPATANVALGAEVIAQSTQPGFSAGKVNDGVQSDVFGAELSWLNGSLEGDPPSSWVGVDLKTPMQISEVEVFTALSFELSSYDIEVKVDGTWAPMVRVTDNRATHRAHPLPSPVMTSGVRVNGHRGGGLVPNFLVVNELVVTGCKPPPPTQITGKITRFQGGPLSGVSVEIGGRTVTTNASGDYRVTDLRPGTYTVHPAKPGFTFGSERFQVDKNAVTVSREAPNATKNAVGYDRNPIVYVHGFNSSPSTFAPSPKSELAAAGYAPFFAELVTSFQFTPRFEDNAGHVIAAIDQATYETGQTKVILVAHSMGGLVSRAYLETRLYRNDVSQFFSFGSPHLGVPTIIGLACQPNLPGVCQMTLPGMQLFNSTHAKRSDVDYHEIAGDAPMFETRRQCFRISFLFFRKTFCISYSWPDTSFRNVTGWLSGLFIAGPDDGLIGTCSAIGQPGNNIDRLITREVHTHGLGDRDYFDWNHGVSLESYAQCLKRVLVDRVPSCGQRSLRVGSCAAAPQLASLLGPRRTAAAGSLAADAATPAAGQRAAPQTGRLVAGQQVVRTVVVEGGGTTFSVNVSSGSAALSLVDPHGQVIDPAYITDISSGSLEDPDVETTDMPTGVALYSTTGGTAQYVLPNASPGVWTVLITGNQDLPAGGATFTAEVGFDSTFVASLQSDAAFLTPGTTAGFSIQLPPVASASATMVLALSDGTTVPLVPVAGDSGYAATLAVPATSGYAQLRWSITGTRLDGVAFERGGVEDLQITATSLSWEGVVAESTVPRSIDPSLVAALVLQGQIGSSYTGEAQIAADLIARDGATIAHTTQSLSLARGANRVALQFSGDDIYAAGIDGPYTLANVTVVDTRADAVLAASSADRYTTAAYRVARFAVTPGVPTVTTTGPYSTVAGDSVRLEAAGVDPDGDPLSFAWDLDGDGTYETAGRTVTYQAPVSSSSLQVGVRVTDPAGHAATATTTIDVLPREVNLALTASASASSSLPGYTASHVNDGDTSLALDPGVSWANEARFSCTITDQGPVCTQTSTLPATLDLDLGAVRTIKRLTLYTGSLLPIQDYDVSVWDGTAWNLVERVRGNTQAVRSHDFVPRVGSKLRLTAHRGPDVQPYLARVNELQVFGF